MTRLRLDRIRSLLSRFSADRTGATAIEFAFVALPFFTLLFAIIQTALVMFGSQALQSMTATAGRKIMTGEMKGKTFADFKTTMCSSSGMSAMFDCAKMMVQVQAFDNFSGANMDAQEACFKLTPPPPGGCYNSGGRNQIVIVRVSYDWPFAIDLEDLDHKTRITAVAAFRNEPF